MVFNFACVNFARIFIREALIDFAIFFTIAKIAKLSTSKVEMKKNLEVTRGTQRTFSVK